MQVIFGHIEFSSYPFKAVIKEIKGIVEVSNEDEANVLVGAVDQYDYVIPEIYVGKIIYECPKLIHI